MTFFEPPIFISDEIKKEKKKKRKKRKKRKEKEKKIAPQTELGCNTASDTKFADTVYGWKVSVLNQRRKNTRRRVSEL